MWRKFIKRSCAYQLEMKVKLLKKEIKAWKKYCYNKDYHVLDKSNRDFGKKQYHLMNNYVDVSAWQQVDSSKIQLERNYIEQEIHRTQRSRQSWFQFGENIIYTFKLWPLLGNRYGKLRIHR